MNIFQKEDLLKLITHLENLDIRERCIELGATEETLNKVKIILHINDNFIENGEICFNAPLINREAIINHLIKLNLFDKNLEAIETDTDNPYIFEESLVSVKLILAFNDEKYFNELGYYTYGIYRPDDYDEMGEWQELY